MLMNIRIPVLDGSESLAERDRIMTDFLDKLIRELNVVLANIGDENINFRDISVLKAEILSGLKEM